MNKKYEKTFELGGRKLTLTTGILAEQASGAVMARYGDTVILATVTHVPLKQEFDYFPLSVEYQEKLYAGGKIKGSRWVKREGRPTDKEILTARLIDRSIRPLFPKDYKKEVQVIVAVLSVDGVNDPSILVVSSTKDAVLMIEAGAKEVSEKVILDGVKLAFEEAQKINTAISELADEIGI